MRCYELGGWEVCERLRCAAEAHVAAERGQALLPVTILFLGLALLCPRSSVAEGMRWASVVIMTCAVAMYGARVAVMLVAFDIGGDACDDRRLEALEAALVAVIWLVIHAGVIVAVVARREEEPL